MKPDYFANHPRGSRFPWSIYHRPLERSLATFLGDVGRAAPAPTVLVLGAGYLHELREVPRSVRLTAVDVDQRVIARLETIRDDRLTRCAVITGAEDLASLGSFDAVYAKEVIEHIVDIDRYMAAMRSVLKPGGALWLSTPNYGDPWLPLVESTALELIGRLSGYSRKDIHPTRFSSERLRGLLGVSGFEAVQVERTPLRLALVGTGRKPDP